MPNPYGWGDDKPQIKPKDQGGETVATFSQKVYNLFDNLFDTLNSYPWSEATQSNVGYMSAEDKKYLDTLAESPTLVGIEDSSVPNDVVTNVATVDIPPGCFLVIAYLAFAANDNGYRQMGFGLNVAQPNSSRFLLSRVAACPSAATNMILPTVINNTGTTPLTYYLNVRQNSGVALNVGNIGIIKKRI